MLLWKLFVSFNATPPPAEVESSATFLPTHCARPTLLSRLLPLLFCPNNNSKFF